MTAPDKQEMRKIGISLEEIALLYDALLDASAYFQHRDEMNAFVHCAPTRQSPITIKVEAAANLCSGIRAAMEAIDHE